MWRIAAKSFLGVVSHGALIGVGASCITLALFLVLPLLQAIASVGDPDTLLVATDEVVLAPPPLPPVEEPPEPEKEPAEPPPQLAKESAPLELSQLELALEPGFGQGSMGGDFAVGLHVAAAGVQAVEELFSLADLDQEPRAVYQPDPVLDAKARKRTPGTAWIVFVVDERGRVQEPRVQRSTDPVFERPALAAVKQWRFEPGMRNGQPVSFRMRVPITFSDK